MRTPRFAILGALLALLLVQGRAAAVEAWPVMPKPPKAELQWVAQSMRVNGVPTRVMQYQSRMSQSELIAYYRSHWSRGYDFEPSVKDLGKKTVVGQKHGPYVMTVSIEDGGRGTSKGLISVAQFVGARPDRSPGELTLMPGASVAQVVESDDPGKHSRQVLIFTSQSPASVSRFYQSSLLNAGWRQLHVNQVPKGQGRPAGAFATYRRGESEMQLSISAAKGKGTVLLANHVTNDTGRGAP
jgi:hypothetical protein